MKINVVSDARGRILSLSVPGDVGPGPSGIARGGVPAEPGQHTHVLAVPAEYAHRPLAELHSLLRVGVMGGKPALMSLKTFREPYLHEGDDGVRPDTA